MSTEQATPLEAEVVSIETTINDALVKANVTDAIIAGLKQRYGSLVIKGQDDREGYTAAKDARKECKSWRVTAEKICKKGREEAVAVQKAWVAKEKEVTGKIAEVEDYLEKQEKEYEAEKERIKQELKKKHDSQFASRSIELSKLGATFDGSNFTIEDVSYEASLIREADDDIYSEDILPKFKAIFDKNEAIRIAAEKEKQDAEEKLRKGREDFEKQQAELKRQQEEVEAQVAEAKRIKEENEARIFRQRLSQLEEVVWNGQEAVDKFYTTKSVASYLQLISLSESEWGELRDAHNSFVKERIAMQAEMRRAEIEKEKALAQEEGARKERERIAEEKRLAEEKRIEDEKQRQEEAEKASDKEKWAVFVSQIEELKLPTVTGKHFSAKLKKAIEKLEEIKAL